MDRAYLGHTREKGAWIKVWGVIDNIVTDGTDKITVSDPKLLTRVCYGLNLTESLEHDFTSGEITKIELDAMKVGVLEVLENTPDHDVFRDFLRVIEALEKLI